MTRIFNQTQRNLNIKPVIFRRSALSGMVGLMAVLAMPFTLAAQADAPLRIVATTGMIADAARQTGGGLVDVKGLIDRPRC